MYIMRIKASSADNGASQWSKHLLGIESVFLLTNFSHVVV